MCLYICMHNFRNIDIQEKFLESLWPKCVGRRDGNKFVFKRVFATTANKSKKSSVGCLFKAF